MQIISAIFPFSLITYGFGKLCRIRSNKKRQGLWALPRVNQVSVRLNRFLPPKAAEAHGKDAGAQEQS
jgi:hypothetical protein